MNAILIAIIATLCVDPQSCTDYYTKCMDNTWSYDILMSRNQRQLLCSSELLDELHIPYKLELQQ